LLNNLKPINSLEMRATNLILIAISFCTLLNSCSEKDKKFEKLVWSDEFDYWGICI